MEFDKNLIISLFSALTVTFILKLYSDNKIRKRNMKDLKDALENYKMHHC